MGRYIKWHDVVGRHRMFADIVQEGEAETNYIAYAENYIDAALSKAWTTPFSSNNLTAMDLAIDVAFAKTQQFNDPKKYESIMTHVGSMIGALNDGSFNMVTSSGDAISSDGIDPSWSPTMNYTPVFGKGDELSFVVDSDQLYDEEVARL